MGFAIGGDCDGALDNEFDFATFIIWPKPTQIFTGFQNEIYPKIPP
jgi:hypothetical protein